MRGAKRTAAAVLVGVCAAVASACSGGGSGQVATTTTSAPPTSAATSSVPGADATSTTAPAGPSVPVGPTPTIAGGEFQVFGPDIIGPDGRAFIPVGTNMNGPNSFFDVATQGKAAGLQQQWGFNTIRLVTCLPSGCQGQNQTANNDLDGIVAEYTSQHLVVMIEYHQLGPGEAATAEQIRDAVGFWTDLANRFKDNPYVWFNLFNEPDATFNDADRGTSAPARWRAQHQPVIDAIRAPAPRTSSWSTTPRPAWAPTTGGTSPRAPPRIRRRTGVQPLPSSPRASRRRRACSAVAV